MGLKYSKYISDIYTPTMFADFLHGKNIEKNISILRKTGIINSNEKLSIKNVYKRIFSFLSKNYRSEELYKSILFSKIILPQITEDTDTILSELRISSSKADLTMFNGKSVGYEIKSELDKPVRLKTQISDYLSFFQYSYLVSHETFIENYKRDLPKSIGIICVNRNGSVEIIKKASDNTENISHSALFHTLRKPEYSDIINKHYNYTPSVPNGIFFKECKKLFDKIPINVANKLSVDSLKRRRVGPSVSYIKKLPIYLQYLVYYSNLRQEDLKKLNSFVGGKI